MKSNQIVERKFFGHVVRQEHLTGFLCVTDFLKIANQWRLENGISKLEKKPKELNMFWKTESCKSFMTELAIEKNCLQKDLKKIRRGQYSGVWSHPSLFLKIALWTSPRLEVKVYDWVMDELLCTRDEGGETFKEVMSDLRQHYPEVKNNPIWHTRISRVVYRLCGLPADDSKRWNKASIKQHKKRAQIHEQLMLLKSSHKTVEDLLIFVWKYNISKGCVPSPKSLEKM